MKPLAWFAGLLTASLLCATAGPAQTLSPFDKGSGLSGQAYPTRLVRLIVPSSPGGGTDTSARIIAPKLSELLGQGRIPSLHSRSRVEGTLGNCAPDYARVSFVGDTAAKLFRIS